MNQILCVVRRGNRKQRTESIVGNSCSGYALMNRWDAQDSSSIQNVGKIAQWLRTSVWSLEPKWKTTQGRTQMPGRQRQEDPWGSPANCSIATLSSKFSERRCLKKYVEISGGIHLRSTFGFYMEPPKYRDTCMLRITELKWFIRKMNIGFWGCNSVGRVLVEQVHGPQLDS